jgi:hypothetical protein
VNQRFTIEDLVAQNEWGVVYRAFDTKTAQTVGIRRFFPFGHAAGGLDSEEQTAYSIAIERLAGLHHPAMRSIIWGGCDPVDQMPFIVTEWIEGFSLGFYTEHAPLKHADAIRILIHALEVCEVLSELFAEEAVWIETDLESIIVGKEGSGRGATFWISPMKWLGSARHKRGLGAIIQLTEEIMHWQGKLIPDEAGGGLGAWLSWLRQESETVTLHQAREMLSAAIGMEPPPSPTKLVQAATMPDGNPRQAGKKGLSRTMLAAICTVLLLIAVGVAWWWTQRRHPNAGAMLDRMEAEVIR